MRTHYWLVANGLRGCYTYDSVAVIRASTRRALKEALMDNDPSDGAPRPRAVAGLAAAAWRTWRRNAPRGGTLPMCEPYPDNRGYGLFVAPATRAEYLEHASLAELL